MGLTVASHGKRTEKAIISGRDTAKTAAVVLAVFPASVLALLGAVASAASIAAGAVAAGAGAVLRRPTVVSQKHLLVQVHFHEQCSLTRRLCRTVSTCVP